jgi:hypothetical protein
MPSSAEPTGVRRGAVRSLALDEHVLERVRQRVESLTSRPGECGEGLPRSLPRRDLSDGSPPAATHAAVQSDCATGPGEGIAIGDMQLTAAAGYVD